MKALLIAVAVLFILVLMTGNAAEPVMAEDSSETAEKIIFDGDLKYDNSSDYGNEIYCINPDGSGMVRLTSNTWDDIHPQVSPDGTKIAFQSNRRHNGKYPIYVINADGTGPTQLTEERSWGQTWSPDSAQIAYITDDGLYVTDVEGKDHKIIYQGAVSLRAWLPDSNQIYCITSEGALLINPQTLAKTPAGDILLPDPAQSPDKTRYAFFNEEYELYVANLDGSNPFKLTEAQKSPGGILWISVKKGQFESSIADSFAANWDTGKFLMFLLVYGFPILLVIFLIYWQFDKRRLRKLARAKDIKYP